MKLLRNVSVALSTCLILLGNIIVVNHIFAQEMSNYGKKLTTDNIENVVGWNAYSKLNMPITSHLDNKELYIPASWGKLMSVNPTNKLNEYLMFFQAEDNTIYVIKGVYSLDAFGGARFMIDVSNDGKKGFAPTVIIIPRKP